MKPHVIVCERVTLCYRVLGGTSEFRALSTRCYSVSIGSCYVMVNKNMHLSDSCCKPSSCLLFCPPTPDPVDVHVELNEFTGALGDASIQVGPKIDPPKKIILCILNITNSNVPMF